MNYCLLCLQDADGNHDICNKVAAELFMMTFIIIGSFRKYLKERKNES